MLFWNMKRKQKYVSDWIYLKKTTVNEKTVIIKDILKVRQIFLFWIFFYKKLYSWVISQNKTKADKLDKKWKNIKNI